MQRDHARTYGIRSQNSWLQQFKKDILQKDIDLKKRCGKNGSKLERRKEIDCIKLQTGKSFPVKELPVLVANKAKERELVACMLTLCFH